MRDGLFLAGRFAVELARIGIDAAADVAGLALPLRPERLASSDALGRLLRDFGPHAGADLSAATPLDVKLPDVKLLDVRLLDIETVSSNCRNVVLRLESRSPQSSRGAIPDTVFVKLPCREIRTRAFCNALGVWAIECHFYRHAASRVPIRVPRFHAVATRGTRFVLVLENLHASPEVRLFANSDMAAGTTPEIARRCLTTLAELHAAFQTHPPAERDAILPMALHPFLSPRLRSLALALNAAAVAPCHRRAPELFPRELVDLYRRALARWDTLVGLWYKEPLTLLHGDSHLGNFFADGERMGMLDFQAAHWGPGIRDVQYFLINSLPPEVLAAHEGALVGHYLDELDARGAATDRDVAWRLYRAFSFQTLMTAVVSFGLGPLTEEQSVVRTVLARSTAAVRRLRFAEWLDDSIGADF